MADLYDINNWTIRTDLKPLMGKRVKDFIENPSTGELYFFKESKEGYPSEIWSEIIASKFGQKIGLNVLDYNIAIIGSKIGCISKRMVSDNQMLYHGIDIIKDNIKGFKVTDKPKYSFQDIEKILNNNVEYKSFINNIIEIILFDALIGNGDRHLENWAFIINYGVLLQKKGSKEVKNILKDIYNNLLSGFSNFKKKSPTIANDIKIKVTAKTFFSPIYDSGSCLGREKSEDVIENFLKDKVSFNAYLKNKRGSNEIRWNGEKVNFFELASNVQRAYPDKTNEIANKLVTSITEELINDIVYNVDAKLEGNTGKFKLSLWRKKMIVELLRSRTICLRETLNLN